jgi:hypothetical protein
LKGSTRAKKQNRHIFFNLQFRDEQKILTHRNLLLGASNLWGFRQLGPWVRCKTERGDRGDHRDMLTNGGDRWRWPDFEEG